MGFIYSWSAYHIIKGSSDHLGQASNWVIIGVSLFAVLWVTNQGGLGQIRNGPYITLF